MRRFVRILPSRPELTVFSAGEGDYTGAKRQEDIDMKKNFFARFFRCFNPAGLRLLFTAGSVVDIREAVSWERRQNVEK